MGAMDGKGLILLKVSTGSSPCDTVGVTQFWGMK